MKDWEKGSGYVKEPKVTVIIEDIIKVELNSL